MAFEFFVALVAGLGMAYAGISKYLQGKLTNKNEMAEIQAESKALSEELKKAQDSKDKKRIDEAMQNQMNFLPKMNKIMMGQMKVMFVVLGVFFVFMWVLGQVDPTVKDDQTVVMADDGNGVCDQVAGDLIYTGCYKLESTSYGRWTATVQASRNKNLAGKNSTYFGYNIPKVDDTLLEAPQGEQVIVTTDKASYLPGETVKVFAQVNQSSDVVMVLDSGTRFYVDLPFTIPIVNVYRIQQPYWWFILMSLITNVSISIITSQLEKSKAKEAK